MLSHNDRALALIADAKIVSLEFEISAEFCQKPPPWTPVILANLIPHPFRTASIRYFSKDYLPREHIAQFSQV